METLPTGWFFNCHPNITFTSYGTTSAQLDTRAAATYSPSDPRFEIETFSLFKQIICRNGNDMNGRPSAQAKLAALFSRGQIKVS